MKKLVSIVMATLALGMLSSCSSISYEKGDEVFTDKIIFDTSVENPKNVNYYLGVDANVKSVKSGRVELGFGFKNKILTLSGASLKECGAGEKTLKVTYEENGKEKSKSVFSFNATKFITTPQEFQDINNKLDGYYILMNDIDFKNFGNFEPLGHYTYEEDPNKEYFHGIFDGNGYAIKNLTTSYSDGPTSTTESRYPTNYDVYSGHPKYTMEGHKMGNNVGVWQFIGSSGVVKNTVFDNVSVHGHTISGVIAGNCSGQIQNCLVNSNCQVLIDAHFWDDDCNVGGAVGIVGGSGKVVNTVCLTKDVSVRGAYEDYNDDYIGESSTGYDHGGNVNNNYWRFWNDFKVVGSTSEQYLDSNGRKTNGTYAFVGKCWGLVSDSVAAQFDTRPYKENPEEIVPYAVSFGQTHVGANKPSSGSENLGEISNCGIYDDAGLKNADNYAGFDTNIWNITNGSYPSIKVNLVPTIVAE